MFETHEAQKLVGKMVYRKKAGKNTTYLVVSAVNGCVSLKSTHTGGRFTYKSAYRFLIDYALCEKEE